MDNRILAKYIFNETTVSEKASVEKWLAESPGNGEELERLRERLDLAARRYRPGMFYARGTRTRFSREYIIRYAVVAVIAIIVGVWLYIQPSREKIILVCQAGEVREFCLPDSSQVTLSGSSELIYIPEFKGHSREVSMKGKAYFSVRRDLEKPFIVKTSTVRVQVLGTVFQVMAEPSRAEVMVEHGRVKVTAEKGEEEEILGTGMSASFETEKSELEVSKEFDINKLGWKTGVFKFYDISLPEVIRELEQYYNVKIELPSEYTTLRITVAFDRIPLKDALEVINQTLDIDLKSE